MEFKVVLTDRSWPSYDEEIRNLPKTATIGSYPQISTEEELIEKLKGADAAMSEYAPFTRRVLNELKDSLKIIANTTIGVDNIDIEAAKEFGIAVANVPNYCSYEVADHTMALMLALMRNVVTYERKVREGIWDINDAPPLVRLKGQKLGLLGLGSIPQMIVKRAKAFEMEIMAVDPYIPQEVADDLGVKLVSQDEILKECDIISCHLPLLPSTEGSLNKEFFDKAEKKPLFINTSRGKVVNEKDLAEALKSGKIRGAALDVLEEEPPDFDSEIFKLDNVIITPHAAFYSETALQEVQSRSAKNVVSFFEGNYDEINFIVKP